MLSSCAEAVTTYLEIISVGRSMSIVCFTEDVIVEYFLAKVAEIQYAQIIDLLIP